MSMMSLQRRLVLYLLVCAPLAWGVALYFAVRETRHEVNELFDTQLLRLAQQVQATLGQGYPAADAPRQLPPAATDSQDSGDAEVRDLTVTVWDANGHLALANRDGLVLPLRAQTSGFRDVQVQGAPWRAYYLPSDDGQWQVAAGHALYERDEVVRALTLAQVVPWLLMLLVLLVAIDLAARRALAPVRRLADELAARDAQDLYPVPDSATPTELRPLLGAMNSQFVRIQQLLQRERRFTADAAHELRTPLAVLRAQWDVVRQASTPEERRLAEDKLSAGLERMERLVTQMLALARAESGAIPDMASEIDWPALVEQAMSDCLALATRRHIELACEWPPAGRHPLPMLGNPHLLTVLLRNLLDNAVRYAPPGSTVVLRFDREHLEVDNEGPPLAAEQLERLGERFYRPEGQRDGGSGLGLSIVRRIAQLHGLALRIGPQDDGQGVRARLQFDAAQR